MKKTPGQTHLERESEDRVLATRMDLADLEQVVQSLKQSIRKRKRVVVGFRAFSMQEILDEVRAGTPHGQMFRRIIGHARAARFGGAKG
jgi:phage terminase Nu1 subunit (DNA packaging protein)